MARNQNTIIFYRLKRRVEFLERNYLPSVKLSGNYTSKEQDDIRAYSFLVHAELEYYFEETSKNKVLEAINSWCADNSHTSQVLMYLSCFHACKLTSSHPGCHKYEDRIKDINSYYQTIISQNNGIKEPNVLNMLLPIGVPIDAIDQTWLTTLSNFGNTRGTVAHKGAQAQRMIDPGDIKRDVDYILSELKILDRKIRKLK